VRTGVNALVASTQEGFANAFWRPHCWLLALLGAAALAPTPSLQAQESPPTILEQPTGQIVALGSSVSLRAEVAGTGPIQYQWRLNGVNLPGATSPTYSIPEFRHEHAGAYRLAAANALGAVQSSPAVVAPALGRLPFGDPFGTAGTVSDAQRSGIGTNAGATREPDEPGHAQKPGGRSIWLHWAPPATGIATVRTTGSAVDTVLAIYTGPSIRQLTEVASDDDGGGFLTSEVRFNVRAGTAYHIAIDGFAAAEGALVLSWDLERTPDVLPVIQLQPQSQSVAPGGAATLRVSATGDALAFQWLFHGNPIPGATADTLNINPVLPTVVGSYAVRVTSGTRSIDSRAASLQIHSSVNGSADALATDKLPDLITAVRRQLGLLGPGPDRRSQPLSLARGFTGTQIFSTLGASRSPNEPSHCGILGGGSQWFAYRPEADGLLRVDTTGSTFDTVLGIYTVMPATFALAESVGCDNDSGPDGKSSRVEFNAAAGRIYYVAIDGVNGATGTVQLNYALTTPLRFTLLPNRGTFGFRVSGPPALAITLQSSNDLVDWQPLLTTNPASGLFEFIDLGAGMDAQRFFRALSGTPGPAAAAGVIEPSR
jgi:hypothetical protein